MADSEYFPSLWARIVGGIQWGVTAILLVGILSEIFMRFFWEESLFWLVWDTVAILIIVLGMAGGIMWVGFRTKSLSQERSEHRKRVEYILAIFPLSALLIHAIVQLVPDIPFWVLTPVLLGGTLLFAFVMAYVLELELFRPIITILT